MKRYLSFLLILLFLFCSCGSPGTGAGKKSSEITVVTPFADGDGHREDYLELIAGFEKETGIKVNDLSNERSSEKWKAEVIELFKTGGEPDVLFFFNGAMAAPLIEPGNVIALDTIREKYPNYALNIKPGVLKSMKYSNGKNYCVPVTGFWESSLVNMELFTNNGLTYPETFEELVECCKKLREAGVTPIAANIKSTPHYLFEYLVYNYTGPSQHELFVTEGDNYSNWAEGLKQFNDLYEAGAFPDDLENITDERCLEMLINKEAAIMVDGSWSPAVRAENGPVVKAFPAPEGGRRKNTDIIGGFSMGYYITKKGWENNADAAARFVSYVSGDTSLSAFNKGGSASPGAWEGNEASTETLKSAAVLISSSTAFIPAVQDTFKPEAREYLFNEILGITEGKTDINRVLDKFIDLSK